MSRFLPKKNKNKNKEKVKFKIKDEYFIRNGGILLEKQIALSKGKNIRSTQLKVFSVKDIEEATNNFDPDLVIAKILGTMFRVSLEDRAVAIRAPVGVAPRPDMIDRLLTEAAIGAVMNHYNMVKLYGCCLETCIPMLVYKYLPNKSLFRHLHGAADTEILKWGYRLRVAIDISYALSYMHNALLKPVVHRGLLSHIILLDDSFHAKLSNFGHSVVITPGESTREWPVQGCPGYIDPEYIQTQEVTDKCDVYSFGVLMLELLTRKEPHMMAKNEMDLADVFLTAVRKNCMMEMIDREILDQGNRDEIEKFALLAVKCVSKKGIERPNMIEVVSELWLIQGRESR